MIGKSDSESMIHERKKQLDKISLRKLLTELYHGLNVTVVKKMTPLSPLKSTNAF